MSPTIAHSFRELDFHDDTFVGLYIRGPEQHAAGGDSTIEVELQRRSDGQPCSVRFSGCANARVVFDFDVLADNLPNNTSGVEVDSSPDRIRQFIQSQVQDWDVEYSSGVPSPLDKKFSALSDLVFFRIQFFGGVVDVVATSYVVEVTNG